MMNINIKGPHQSYQKMPANYDHYNHKIHE